MTTRTVPRIPIGSAGSLRVLERNLKVYRRLWSIIFSGFFEPVFYLFSIGVGLGVLIGDLESPSGEPISYATFVAPALLASAAMNGAVFESFNIFFKMKYAKLYDGMLATPLTPRDLAIGEILWSQTRGGLYSAAFVIVMLAMGLMASPFGILALPAAVFVGFCFGAIGIAAVTFMRSWQDFDLITLAVMPMFLFSATFYPLSVYPGWLQTVARFSPLYHATDLLRGLTLGTIDWSIAGHIAVLAAMAAVGLTIASRRLEKLLLS